MNCPNHAQDAPEFLMEHEFSNNNQSLESLLDDEDNIVVPVETQSTDNYAMSFARSSLSTLISDAIEDLSVGTTESNLEELHIDMCPPDDLIAVPPLFHTLNEKTSRNNFTKQHKKDKYEKTKLSDHVSHQISNNSNADEQVYRMFCTFQTWSDVQRDNFIRIIMPNLRLSQINILSQHLIPHILPHLSPKILSMMAPSNMVDSKLELSTRTTIYPNQKDNNANLSKSFHQLVSKYRIPDDHTSPTGRSLSAHEIIEYVILNKNDIIKWLPMEISLRIFRLLDPVSLARCSKVSRKWRIVSTNEVLWKTLFMSKKWSWCVTERDLKEIEDKVENLMNIIVEKAKKKSMDVETAVSLAIGRVWKFAFRERYRIRRNWINGNCSVRTFESHTQGVSCLQFDENYIASGSYDNTLKLWALRTNTHPILTLIGHSGTIRCLQFDSKKIVSGSNDRTLRVWDIEPDSPYYGQCIGILLGHIGPVRCLQVGRLPRFWDEDVVKNEQIPVDRCLLVSGSYDCSIKIWRLDIAYSNTPIETRLVHNCIRTLVGHMGAVISLQFEIDGENDGKLVSGSADCTIRLWNLYTGECLRVFEGHSNAVTCLQFDSCKIVSGSLDNSLKFWNIRNGECEQTIDWVRSEGHKGVVRNLKFDQWLMVSSSDDKTLKVWELFDSKISQLGVVGGLKRMLTLKRHTDGVTCLQFDYRMIVSGSFDKTVKVWDFSAP